MLRKFEPFTFVRVKKADAQREVVGMVVRQEKNDLFYRNVREDGALGKESVVLADDRFVTPTPVNEFRLMVEYEPRSADNSKWEVSLPAPSGRFIPVSQPMSRAAAVRLARATYKADSRGRVTIINKVSGE